MTQQRYGADIEAKLGALLQALHRDLKQDDALAQGGLNGQNFIEKWRTLLPRLAQASAWIVLQKGVADHKMAVFREAIDAGQDLAGFDPADRLSLETANLPRDASALRRTAETCYRVALEIDPQYANAAFNLARLREDAGDRAEAFALYERASSDAFYRPHALMRISLAQAERGDLGSAIKCLKEALTLFPHFGQHHFRIAELFRRAGLIDEALVEFAKTIDTVHYYAPEFVLRAPNVASNAS